MKKCPPGVICLENYSLFFIIMCFFILIYLVVFSQKTTATMDSQSKQNIIINNRDNRGFGGWIPDMFNPYVPPLRNEQLVPINVSTNIGAVDTSYRQVGILNATNTKGKVLPLMGRPLFTNRDKWQYYTTSPDNHVKLPVSRGGKSCTNEYGCDKIYNGDTVFIEGIQEVYNATLYDIDTMRYLPFV
jgi:hypothetical protein